jgi:cell division protein FtsW (lipid II flippase)
MWALKRILESAGSSPNQPEQWGRWTVDKGPVRIFFDHLYFSVCCILVGFLVVYSAAAWVGYGFNLDENMALCTIIGLVLALALAFFLTYLTIRRRPRDFIVRTKRQE